MWRWKKLPVKYYYHEDLRHHVNLSYITADETSHYILLKELSRLISRQNNNHNDKNISVNIAYMAKPVERYWKKQFGKMQVLWGHKISEAEEKKKHNKVKPTITEHQLRLSFIIYLACTWNAVMGSTLNHHN